MSVGAQKELEHFKTLLGSRRTRKRKRKAAVSTDEASGSNKKRKKRRKQKQTSAARTINDDSSQPSQESSRISTTDNTAETITISNESTSSISTQSSTLSTATQSLHSTNAPTTLHSTSAPTTLHSTTATTTLYSTTATTTLYSTSATTLYSTTAPTTLHSTNTTQPQAFDINERWQRRVIHSPTIGSSSAASLATLSSLLALQSQPSPLVVPLFRTSSPYAFTLQNEELVSFDVADIIAARPPPQPLPFSSLLPPHPLPLFPLPPFPLVPPPPPSSSSIPFTFFPPPSPSPAFPSHQPPPICLPPPSPYMSSSAPSSAVSTPPVFNTEDDGVYNDDINVSERRVNQTLCIEEGNSSDDDEITSDSSVVETIGSDIEVFTTNTTRN